MKFCGAVLIAQKQPLELMDLELPPLKLGQVLIKVLTSGICGSQLGEIDGIKGPDRYLPHLLGHEGCGEVLEVGEGVRTVKPGDRVVLHWRKGAGIESVPAVYRGPSGLVNAGWVTTFQEYTVVSENRVTAIPADFDPAQAALLGCAVTTAAGVLANDARLAVGESVVVLGSGGVGLSIVQLAVLAGAFPIIAVDRHANRLELAMQLGASHTVNTATGELRGEVKGILENGADVVVENTGVPNLIEAAAQLLGRGGRLVLVGVPPSGSTAALDTLPLHFDRTITGSYGGNVDPTASIPRLVRLAAIERLNLSQLVGKTCPLLDINHAITGMRNGSSAGRFVLTFG